MKINVESLKTSGNWLGAASGVGVPAISFFSSYSPPLFPGISLFTVALSSAILLITFAWNPKSEHPEQGFTPILNQGKRFIFCSLPVLIAYVLFFQFTTVSVPDEPQSRIQIGFGRFEWALTEAGKMWIIQNPSITINQMVENEAAFTQDRVTIIWKIWSIVLAGALLIVFYFAGFITWTIGFALLAKQRSISRNPG